MRDPLMAGTASLLLVLGAAGDTAKAQNPNVPSWSPYAIIEPGAAPRATKPGPKFEGRAAYTNGGADGVANGYVDYKSVGLSNHPEDCASMGCALSNGE